MSNPIFQAAGPYDPTFFDGQSAASRISARRVIEVVLSITQPSSVLDVGCGVGTWLAEWIDAGIEDICAVDGEYVPVEKLQVPAEKFRGMDLAQPIELGRRFDLVQCLEVAEHLEQHDADTLVANLTRHSNTVLFSAAIPGQGGTNHVNEQWQSYWIAKFAAAGYQCCDWVRPSIWSDRRVDVWYRQNIFLFSKNPGELVRPAAIENWMTDVVHPDLWSVYSGAQLWKMAAERFGRKLPNQAKRILRKQPWVAAVRP